MKFLIIFLISLNFALAAETTLEHAIHLKIRSAKGGLSLFILKVTNSTLSEATYRYELESRQKAKVLKLESYKTGDENYPEALKRATLELSAKQSISVTILDDQTCEVTSTNPTVVEIVPCRYSINSWRGGMSGSN